WWDSASDDRGISHTTVRWLSDSIRQREGHHILPVVRRAGQLFGRRHFRRHESALLWGCVRSGLSFQLVYLVGRGRYWSHACCACARYLGCRSARSAPASAVVGYWAADGDACARGCILWCFACGGGTAA